MKTTFLLPILVLLIVPNTFSQGQDVAFNRLHTRQTTLKGHTTSEIYSVSYARLEHSANPEYTKLKSELEKLEADSISQKADYDQALVKFNDVLLIKNKVVEFNSSNQPLGNKMPLLKEAQILATKHQLPDLLYSDNDLNKHMKAGFLLLTLKPEDLTAHLNKVLLRLEDKIKAPELPNHASTVEIRRQLSRIETQFATDLKYSQMLQDNVVAPEDIVGEFAIVNSYYVLSTPTNGFVKNQLVPKKTVSSLGITSKKLASKEEKLLIQNKLTKEMYLVDANFINNFSVKS